MNAVAMFLVVVFVLAAVLDYGKVALLAGILLVLWLGYLLFQATRVKP